MTQAYEQVVICVVSGGRTITLIDQVVCKLCGLAVAEIVMVEGEARPVQVGGSLSRYKPIASR